MQKSNYFLEKELTSGHFDEVISATIENPNYQLVEKDFPWIIAALSFLGRDLEIDGIYKLKTKLKFNESDDCISRFYYGLSLSRRRLFDKSKILFLENFYLFKSSNDTLTKFYIFQGLAFFRYSTGFLQSARFWSEKAVFEASASLNIFSSFLAHELYGHILCNLGNLSEGFKKFEVANKKSLSLGKGGIESVSLTVMALYRASFGINDANKNLSDLSVALFKLDHTVSYSKAALSLELASVKILMGDLVDAKSLLEKMTHQVYEINNPYLEIKYNLSFAYILYLEGELTMAQVLLKASIDKAKEKYHLGLLVKCQGLLYRIFKELGKEELAVKLYSELDINTKKHGSNVSLRILLRENNQLEKRIKVGEDHLGDLIDLVKIKSKSSLEEIFKSGYLLFLKDVLGISNQQNIIYFDLKYRFITIFSKGSVFQLDHSYTEFSKKLLILFQAKDIISKELLVKEIWNQQYDPLRHDGLIYSLINRTRKLLGNFSDWLENNEEGYFLSRGVQVQNFSTDKKYHDAQKEEKILISSNSINTRQLEIIKLSKIKANVTTRLLVDHFAISEATASRDLAKLHIDGYFVKHGSGRSTVYELKDKT